MKANDDTIVRLLESGKNLITTTSYTLLPTYDESLHLRVADACERGKSTFFGTGENPGFMLERVVSTLTGMCERVDQVKLRELSRSGRPRRRAWSSTSCPWASRLRT